VFSKPVKEDGISGLAIMPLLQTLQIDLVQIYNYIIMVTCQLNTQEAHSIPGMCSALWRTSCSCFYLMHTIFRQWTWADHSPTKYANNCPIWVEDRVLSTDELENALAVGSMTHQEKLTLKAFSIGIDSVQVLLQKPFRVLTWRNQARIRTSDLAL